jgi:RNA polymerase sigma-70 factor (ECF subfamily)
LTDEALVLKIRDTKDMASFGILYDRFSKVVYNKCYTFVNNEDEAKDLTQDIFLKLFVKLSSFKGNSKFSTWLYTFTYNHCINYVTRDKKRKYEKRYSHFFEYESIEESKEDSNTRETDFLKKWNYALSQMSDKDKSIIILKYQEKVSIKTLEDLLGVRNSAAKMRVKRAKERFTFYYNEYQEEEKLLKVS